MAFAQSRCGDSNESALLLEFLQRCGADVTHAAPQSANKLICQRAKLAFIGHAALDALRNGFAVLRTLLRVTVGGARIHRAGRAHPAVRLERAALVENGFSGRL